MKRYILSAMAGGVLLLGTAYAQSSTSGTGSQTPPQSTNGEAEHYADRQQRQANRIQNGVNSGQLTQKQAKALQKQNARINNEANRMAQKNGGSLSGRQERTIHRQMNRQSRRITRARR
jgi:predicted transglutaminase-like cysteine proteinase